MIIYAKPGTHSARRMRVKSRSKPPESGDLIYAKDQTAERHARWQRFVVCEIEDVGDEILYFLEHM
jgi:hypothetical protein